MRIDSQVLGAGMAYYFLGERLAGPLAWVGAGLIIASSLAAQLLSGPPGPADEDS